MQLASEGGEGGMGGGGAECLEMCRASENTSYERKYVQLNLEEDVERRVFSHLYQKVLGREMKKNLSREKKKKIEK